VYARLFQEIGTSFGTGNGTTTFNLPDLRGEFLRGVDAGRGVDTGRGLGTAQTDEFKSHGHKIWRGSNTAMILNSTGTDSTFGPNIGDTLVDTAVTGGIETRPRNIAVSYWIKY
jgi:microcystin-dependent protein